MRILFCGREEDCFELVNSNTRLRDAERVFCDREERLLQYMKESRFDSAFVLLDGADGMEAVITLRKLKPELPVIWFSDDKGFAVQSYRLNTAYFHQKPVTPQMIERALQSCQG